MPLDPIQINSRFLDLSARLAIDTSVDASPAAAAETTIAHVAISSGLTIVSGVLLLAQAALTVGTNGVSATLKLRRTDTSGATVATTGALTVTAANLVSLVVAGFDTGPSDGQTYVATLTVGSGSAPSTVSEVLLAALVV